MASSTGSVYINGKRLTRDQWKSGAFLGALQGSAAVQQPGPPKGLPAAPAPMTPAAPQPPDPQLEQAKLSAGRNIALGNSEAAYQTGNNNFDYGYNADGSSNAANPYSRAAMLEESYAASKRGTTNSLASQGQLYSGAMGSAQGRNDKNYARGEADNRLAWQRAQHGIQSGQLANYASNAIGVGDADFNALLRAAYPGG